MKHLLLAVLIAAFLVNVAAADEGFWLFNAFPGSKVKARYGFEPTQAWLDHVRLSSVRFNNGGSGSFVSPDGLTFTNHHVGAKCLQELSSKDRDYLKTGFYAKSPAEEARCPDLELNVLQEMEDATARVNAYVTPGMSAIEAAKAQRSAMSAIEQECTQKTGLRCDLVTLYSGGLYHLYQYKKYTDVRLVFAPEFDTAFFGGDPDNFTYPRYDLDITFFRIYENGKPVHLTHYLKWSRSGVRDGDLVFVSGHPGSTDRLLTLPQLEFMRDVEFPFLLESYKGRIEMLKKFSAQSEENARQAQRDIFGLENSYKAFKGEYEGLQDKQLMDKKGVEEQGLRAAVETDPKKKAAFGNAWSGLGQSVKIHREIYLPYYFLEYRGGGGFRGRLNDIARTLVRFAVEKQKPNSDRLREYRESALPSLEQRIFSKAPIYKNYETAQFAHALAQMQRYLGADHPVVKRVLGGKTPEEVAREAIAGTKLDDIAVRRQLWEGGEQAVAASTDSLIVVMRAIDSEARALRKRYDDEVDAVERRDGALIARAYFAAGGLNTPPDATFTLRLSYGPVKGYVENREPIPYFTTMGGAYGHAARHGNQPPYQLTESWVKNKPRLKLSTPLNFVSTADTIGGNSGSPTINKAGEVVGIIFDGNIQTLPWSFAYSDAQARSVSVDARGIQEALRHIYDAGALADELLAGTAPAAAKPAARPAAKRKARSAEHGPGTNQPKPQ